MFKDHRPVTINFCHPCRLLDMLEGTRDSGSSACWLGVIHKHNVSIVSKAKYQLEELITISEESQDNPLFW